MTRPRRRDLCRVAGPSAVARDAPAPRADDMHTCRRRGSRPANAARWELLVDYLELDAVRRVVQLVENWRHASQSSALNDRARISISAHYIFAIHVNISELRMF